MKLCFTTYVYGWYQDYIPTFILSILTAFPQHFVKIFLEEKLSDANRHCLELIKQNVSDQFEVIESFSELEWTLIPHEASYRFLLTREWFEGFDYIYFGDVDFIIYNEYEDQFYDTYVTHCDKTGLPFSNEWNYDWGKFRMTGLHFVIKDRYFDVMDKWILEMRQPKGNWFRGQCIHNKQHPSYDEEMLFYMAFNAFDLTPLRGYQRPYHGLHFGTFRRLGETDSFAQNRVHITDGRNNLPDWVKNLSKINKVFNSPLFPDIYKAMCPEAQSTIDKARLTLLYKFFV